MPQIAAVETGRIIRKIIGCTERVGKPADIFFLLEKSNRFPFPDPDGSRPQIILDFLEFFGDFIQRLIP